MANYASTISALLLLLFSSSPHVVGASAFAPISTSLSNTRLVSRRRCRNVIVDTSIDARPRRKSSSTISTTMNESTTTPQTTVSTQTNLPAWTHHSEEDVIAVIIDAENVRGRTGFELDHADLLDRLLVWTSMRYGYAYGKTIVVIDHGSQAGAIVLRDNSIQVEDGGGIDHTLSNNLVVSFAGPQCKADDIIARDVNWLLSSSSYNPPSSSNNRRRVVIVVTADQELSYRCRNAAATTASVVTSSDDANVVWKTKKKKSRAERMRQFTALKSNNVVSDENASVEVDDTAVIFPPTVEVISPQRFLEDLDLAVHEWLQWQEQQQHNSSIDDGVDTIKKKDEDRLSSTMSTLTSMEVKKSLNLTTTISIMPAPVSTMSDLFRLRGRILKLESSLRDKLSLHKRSTTLGELRKCKVNWRRLISSLNDGHDRHIEKESVLSSLVWSLSSTIASLEMYDDYEYNNLDMSQKVFTPSLTGTTSMASSWERLSPKDQERLLLHWSKERPSGRQGKNAARKEKTEDRIVLAERLQRQLDLIFNIKDLAFIDAKLDGAPLVDVYSKFVNNEV